MASKLRFDIISHSKEKGLVKYQDRIVSNALFIFEQHQTLSFDLNIVLLLVVLTAPVPNVVRSVFFLFALLFFLLLLGGPDFVDIQQFNGNDISFQRSVAIFGSADIDIGVKNLSRNISVRTVSLVDAQYTDDELPGSKERGEGGLRKVRREK
jgi:hypothetical protein